MASLDRYRSIGRDTPRGAYADSRCAAGRAVRFLRHWGLRWFACVGFCRCCPRGGCHTVIETHEIAPLQPYQAAARGCREHNRLGRQPAGALHRQPALPTSTSCTPSCDLLPYARYPRPDDDPRALAFLAPDLRTIGSQSAVLNLLEPRVTTSPFIIH